MDLSPAQVDTYRRDGFFIVERMFSPAENTTPELLRWNAQSYDSVMTSGVEQRRR